jgi:tRNA pseudouridine38/39 synthase
MYLGYGYQGFASQEDNSNTIEHFLFEALKKTKLIESR